MFLYYRLQFTYMWDKSLINQMTDDWIEQMWVSKSLAPYELKICEIRSLDVRLLIFQPHKH